jgi:hypothetical protein
MAMTKLNELLAAQAKLAEVAAANSGGTPHGTLAELAAQFGPSAAAIPGIAASGASPSPTKYFKLANDRSERQMKLDEIRANKKEAADDKLLKEFEDLNNSIQNITDIATGRRQQKNIGTKIAGIGGNIKDLFTVRGILDKMGVVKKGTGGVLDNMLQNREEKKDYVTTRIKLEKSAAQAAGESIQKFNKKYEREVSASFDRQQKIQNAIIKNEEYIQKMKRQGFSDEQISLSEEIKLRAKLAGELQNEDSRLGKSSDPEARDEQIAKVDEQSKLLKRIATGVERDKVVKAGPEKVAEKTGAWDIATGILGASALLGILTTLKSAILGALKAVFSRAALRLLFRALFVKIALPLSILNGIMDGVRAAVDGAEWKDIISAGLAGLFSGLTLGLVDPEWFKKTFTDDVGAWFEDNVINAMSDIIDNVKEFFTSMVDFVGLVFKAAFPDATAFINKHLGLSIGEPTTTDLAPANKGNVESTQEQRNKQMSNRNSFSTQEELAMASAIKPTTAATVYGKSADNAGAAQGGVSASVVVAPVTNNKSEQHHVAVYKHSPVNTDSTYNRYVDKSMANAYSW